LPLPPIYLTYLNALDVEALALADDEILDAVEGGLAAQGRGETVIEPRMHSFRTSRSTVTSTCCAGPSALQSTGRA
jgi:ornithine cyclodeaminase/alanine dehydrogenase-like protein (mu-crystallin family)